MISKAPVNSLKFSLVSLLLLSATACAQPSNPPTDKGAEKQANTFPIPETVQNVKQLIDFVQELDEDVPTDLNEKELIVQQRKLARTVVAGAKMVAEKKLSDEDAMQVAFLKLQGLRILSQLSEPKADQLLTKEIDSALADKRADIQAVGAKFMVEAGFSAWGGWDNQEKDAWIDRIVAYVTSSEPSGSQVDMVMKVVSTLGDLNGEQPAVKLLSKSIEHFAKSENPRIQDILPLLRGTERRLNLPGNPIQLSGKLLDGSELDWASYRGKIVLVDFWATWCGPCRAEVPHMLKMYEAYHDKGFEVLGISLDEQREQAESYIEQTKIPWPTMFSDNPSERGWQHPMALRYGIDGIPRAILVDREGKVVHMLARGPYLTQELRRLLGEPVARSTNPSTDLIKQVSSP